MLITFMKNADNIYKNAGNLNKKCLFFMKNADNISI